MKVNSEKTQLLCISASVGSEVKSYIRVDNTEIQSVNELKISGSVTDRMWIFMLVNSVKNSGLSFGHYAD